MDPVRPDSIGECPQTKRTEAAHLSDTVRELPDTGRGLTEFAIVDDEDSIRLVLCTLLEQTSTFRCVASYASGEEALLGVPRVRPEIVLMDIRMPGISGLECMRELKQAIPGLIVVLISGLTDPETMASALAAGGDGYLTKPFTASQCLATLTFALRARTPIRGQSMKRIISREAVSAPG
jgi:DNA-binding NarL/FixJ family response regulator